MLKINGIKVIFTIPRVGLVFVRDGDGAWVRGFGGKEDAVFWAFFVEVLGVEWLNIVDVEAGFFFYFSFEGFY